VAADEFATRLAPALSAADDAIFEWLAVGQPKVPDEPQKPLRPDDVAISLPTRQLGGRGTRDRGAPDDVVIAALTEFLEAHRDEQVVVEWRVQE
jgi:hypothetical protein